MMRKYDMQLTINIRYLLMHTELIGNNIRDSLCICGWTRATAVDLVSDSSQLVGHPICYVSSAMPADTLDTFINFYFLFISSPQHTYTHTHRCTHCSSGHFPAKLGWPVPPLPLNFPSTFISMVLWNIYSPQPQQRYDFITAISDALQHCALAHLRVQNTPMCKLND